MGAPQFPGGEDQNGFGGAGGEDFGIFLFFDCGGAKYITCSSGWGPTDGPLFTMWSGEGGWYPPIPVCAGNGAKLLLGHACVA